MSTISWTNAAGGSWSVGGNWSGGVVPTAADDVVIALPGTYSITLSNFDSNPARSVTLNDAAASVSIGFSTTLSLGDVLEMDAGTVSASGTIAGGTIYVPGGTLAASGGTLSGVTVEGYLPLSAPSTGVNIAGGLTLEGVGGVGAGTIDVQSGQLDFYSSQIVSGGTIILENTSISSSGLYVWSPGTLTFAPSATVISKPAGFEVGSILGSVINQGVISGALSLGYVVGTSATLLNQGTVSVGSNQVFTVENAGTLNNTGLLSVAAGGTLALLGAFSSTGSISAAGGTILAGGTVTQAELLALQSSGGNVILTGTLDNASGTLQVGPATALGTLPVTGGIRGGVVQDPGGGIVLNAGTLDGVTYQGTLDVITGNFFNEIINGLTLTGTGGVGPGLAVLTGDLVLGNAETINGGTIDLGGVSGAASFAAASGVTATLGSGVDLEQTGSTVALGGYASQYGFVSSLNGTLVSQGIIDAGFASGTMTLASSSTLMNRGLMEVHNGETLLGQGSLVNAGTLLIGAGSTLEVASFSNSGTVIGTGGTVILTGTVAPAELQAFAGSGAAITLPGTLGNTGGTLQVGPATSLGTLLVTGGIRGGVIQDPGGGIVLNAGTLDGVTYQGTLDVTTSVTSTFGNYLNEVINGLTLTGTGGVGVGVAVVTGDLVLGNAETINAGTIDLGGASGMASFAAASSVTATLGSGVDLEQTGSTVALGGYGVASFGASYISGLSGTLVSQGTIDAGFASGTMTLASGSTLVNNGLMEVRNGETLLAQGSLVNAGTLVIGTGSTLTASAFSSTGVIQGAGGTVVLTGAITPSELQSFAGSGAAITLAGTLNNAGSALQVGPASALGMMTLGPIGMISGGIVQDSGGGLIGAGGRLSGVTYQGPLNLTQAAADLFVQNGITLTGPGGVGPGTVNLSGNNATLGSYYDVNTTLDATAVNIGSSSGDSLIGFAIGASSTVTQTGQRASFSGTNAGTINAAFAGGSFSVSGLTNTGTIAVSNRDVMTITSLANGGQVSVASGAVLNLDSLTQLAGGNVTETGATLNLGGALTLPALATVSRTGGVVALSLGTLDLGGGTLNVGAGSTLGQLRMSVGTISNGTVHDGGSGVVFYSGFGQLQNVTYQGLVNLTPAMSSLIVQGLTATNTTGIGPGAVNLLGASSSLTFDGTQTFDNATINMGSDNATTTLHVEDFSGTGALLTLGPDANLQQRGAMAQINIDRNLGDGLLNQGLIAANDAGGRLILTGGTFTNAGKIVVANGGTFALEADQVGNLPGNVLTGGYWEVDGNSTLSLGFDDPIVTMNATMVLNGPGSQVVYDNTTTFNATSIEQSVNYIGAAGVLVLQNGRAFNDPGLFYDNGKVILSNGSLSGNPIAIGSTGLIYGTGTITANNIYDSGHVMAQGGTLVVNAPLKPGAPVGNALVNTGATLIAEKAVAVPVQFLATTGTLALAQATQMIGTIFGFTGSDAIDLLNVNPAAVTLAYAGNAGGGVLTVKSGAATAASLRFNGSYVLANFHAAADGHGGTLILDPPVGPSITDWRMTQADLQQAPSAPIGASIMNTGTTTIGFGAPPPPEVQPPALLAHH